MDKIFKLLKLELNEKEKINLKKDLDFWKEFSKKKFKKLFDNKKEFNFEKIYSEELYMKK